MHLNYSKLKYSVHLLIFPKRQNNPILIKFNQLMIFINSCIFFTKLLSFILSLFFLITCYLVCPIIHWRNSLQSLPIWWVMPFLSSFFFVLIMVICIWHHFKLIACLWLSASLKHTFPFMYFSLYWQFLKLCLDNITWATIIKRFINLCLVKIFMFLWMEFERIVMPAFYNHLRKQN